MRKSLGFSLIEMVIVMVIVSIIAAVSSTMLNQGFNAYLKGKTVADSTWQARVALSRLAVDLRSIRSSNSITTATSSQLTFTDFNGIPITYQLTSGNLTRNSQILANGITNLAFTYYDANGATTTTASNIRYIRYSFTVSLNNTNLSYSSSIYPRNSR